MINIDMTEFNTIQYCIDNSIPCFTFKMDVSKKTNINWRQITPDNFKQYINSDNGFAVITGHAHFVIDFDEKKHNPPQEIKNTLMENCSAVEETPGGYHFWFKIAQRTEHLTSSINIKWNDKEIIGLDLRAKKGICYTTPSKYTVDNTVKHYKWIKGNLSTATEICDDLLECLTPDYNLINSTIENFKENDKITIKIIPQTFNCLVKEDYIHSQRGHSCIFLTKLKTCYSATANCFSHGKRKIGKEACDALVAEFWPVDDDDIHDEYTSLKDSFEKNNFKVLDPVGFYTFISDKWVFRDRTQLKNAYENMLLMDGLSFIDKWLKDPQMRTYSRISFEASADPTVFVLPELPPPFFMYTTYKCDTHPVPIFDELLDILTNRQQPIKTYILNWLAHLIQKPLELPGVALIFNGQKGAGKDTLGDFIGEYIIGLKHYQNFSNQSQYFDRHDESKAKKFLIKIEEINKKILYDGVNGEIFKASITTPILNFNPKNKPAYSLKNHMRIIATSNNPNPVDVGQKERRYVISVVSPEKIGDSEYWCKVRTELFNPSGAFAVAKMLLERDITNFNPRVLPENEYLKKLQEETMDSVQKFSEYVEPGEYTGSELYQIYKDYCVSEGMFQYSNTKFATQLLFLTENGSIKRSIERKKTNKSNNYIIN